MKMIESPYYDQMHILGKLRKLCVLFQLFIYRKIRIDLQESLLGRISPPDVLELEFLAQTPEYP